MKLALHMIVRNEEKHLMQCLLSAAPYVDHMFIGLAGESTDQTQMIASLFRSHNDFLGPEQVTIVHVPWEDDFSKARNIMLDCVRATKTFTHALWLDGDDELIKGEEMVEAIKQNPDAPGFLVKYEYWRDDFGNPVSLLMRERIFNLAYDWRWKYPIHEICTTTDEGQRVVLQECYVKHAGMEKERDYDRNLRMLKKAVADGNDTPRMTGYMAAEYGMRGDHDEAVLLWQKAAETVENDDERYFFLHRMADSLRVLKRYEESSAADFAAINFKPDWPDAYFGLAETAFARGDWKAVVVWHEHGSRFSPPNTTLVLNPMDYTVNPWTVLSIAYMNLGEMKLARQTLQRVKEIVPHSGVNTQIDAMTREIRTAEVFKAFMQVQEYLRRNDEWLKVRTLFRAAPKEIEGQPEVMKAYSEVMQSTAHVDNPQLMIDYYVGNPGWEAMKDEVIFDPGWWKHPRMAFAIDRAKQIAGEGTILDAGSSDGFVTIPMVINSNASKVDGLDLDPRCVDLANQRAAEHGLAERLKFHQGPFEEIAEWAACENFYKYDLGIFFEAIEHVVDPAATLAVLEKACKHIALTTPYLAWERGETANWNKIELKGHLRIFDAEDIEMLLAHRGVIHNLYVEEWFTPHAWIFADYEVGAEYDKTVEIICPPALETWGPTKLKNEGLGGSETAVIKLGEELAALGHLVTVYNDIDRPGYFNKVRYRGINTFSPRIKTDLAISWRDPSVADDPPNADKLVLWLHDTDAGDRLTPERAEKFDAIVALSHWHKDYLVKRYPFVDPSKIFVIGNGVDPERFLDWPQERDTKKVVYPSSPDRGLDVILEHVWPRVLEQVPDAELHYYYGWQNFEALAHWPHLREFRKKVMELESQTSNVFSHGRLAPDELARELMQSSIWLYPTYFAETYCITAIEAQLAGLLPVTNTAAALSETVGSGIFLGRDVRDPEVAAEYATAVIQAIQEPPLDADRQYIKEKAPVQTWAQVASAWSQFLQE